MDDERITTARQRTSWFRSPWFSIAKCLLCVAMVLLCIWGFQQEAKAASSVITVTLDKNGGTGGSWYNNYPLGLVTKGVFLHGSLEIETLVEGMGGVTSNKAAGNRE